MRAFWIDRDYDRNFASDRMSRFGAYIRRHPEPFWERVQGSPDAVFQGLVTQSAGPFAAAAWTVASPPIMAPGLLRWHRSLVRATAAYDYIDDVVEIHAVLRCTSSVRAEAVHHPEVEVGVLGDDEDPNWPGSTASLKCRIPAVSLHTPDWVPGDEYPAFEDAWESVETLVDYADAAMAPVVADLLEAGSRIRP